MRILRTCFYTANSELKEEGKTSTSWAEKIISGSGEGAREGNACGYVCMYEHGIMKHTIMYN